MTDERNGGGAVIKGKQRHHCAILCLFPFRGMVNVGKKAGGFLKQSAPTTSPAVG